MTMSTVTKSHRNDHQVGERTELGRYRTAAGVERVLYGQRVATVVRVTDVPVESPGRAYLVERGLEEDGLRRAARIGPGLSRGSEATRGPADVDDHLRVSAPARTPARVRPEPRT